MKHWITAILLGACVSACNPVPEMVQDGTTAAAHGVKEADVRVTEQFTELWPEALAEADDASEFAEFKKDWRRARSAINTAYQTLHSTQEIIDAWDDVSRDRKVSALMHALRALRSVAEALVAAGVELPDDLTTAIGLLGGFLGGET